MEATLETYTKIVEKAITTLGVDPDKTRKRTGHWSLKKGKSLVWIYLTPQKENNSKFYLQVSAPIMDVPAASTGDIFSRLLHLNNQLIGAAFVAHRGKVYISAIRGTLQLSAREALMMINRIGLYASFYEKYKEEEIEKWPLFGPS